jgi:hypothetical protein
MTLPTRHFWASACTLVLASVQEALSDLVPIPRRRGAGIMLGGHPLRQFGAERRTGPAGSTTPPALAMARSSSLFDPMIRTARSATSMGLDGIGRSEVTRLCAEIDERGQDLLAPVDQGGLALSLARRHRRQGPWARADRARPHDPAQQRRVAGGMGRCWAATPCGLAGHRDAQHAGHGGDREFGPGRARMNAKTRAGSSACPRKRVNSSSGAGLPPQSQQHGVRPLSGRRTESRRMIGGTVPSR